MGSDEREDLTNWYKFPEGSNEERKAFQLAFSYGSALDYHKGHLILENEGDGLTISMYITT